MMTKEEAALRMIKHIVKGNRPYVTTEPYENYYCMVNDIEEVLKTYDSSNSSKIGDNNEEA